MVSDGREEIKKKRSILQKCLCDLMSSVNHLDFIEFGCNDLCGAVVFVGPHAAQCNGGKVAKVILGPLLT